MGELTLFSQPSNDRDATHNVDEDLLTCDRRALSDPVNTVQTHALGLLRNLLVLRLVRLGALFVVHNVIIHVSDLTKNPQPFVLLA